MTSYVGLLRAVNLAGRNRVAMSELRELLTGLGLKDVQSLLQSGNVVFRSDKSAPALEGLLQEATVKKFGVPTEYFIRSAKEWQAIIAANPFHEAAANDPSHLLVMFLRDSVDRAAVAALRKAIPGREEVHVKGREAFVTYPGGIADSRLSGATMEKTLGRGTARNWNTVVKLGQLVSQL